MRIVSLLLSMVASGGIALAAPMEMPHAETNQPAAPLYPQDEGGTAPRCGYVRLHPGDLYMVGVYSNSSCNVIWQGQEAATYRIDEGGCSCRFYTTEESCEKGDPVPEHTGPDPNPIETAFEDPKPTYVFCQMTYGADNSTSA